MSEPTSDRVPTLDSIQAALEAATPGPWVDGEMPVWESSKIVAATVIEEWDDEGTVMRSPQLVVSAEDASDEDAHLIANAPSWLAYLLARVRDTEAERDQAREVADDGWAWVDAALLALGAETVFDIGDAKNRRDAQVDALREALREAKEVIGGLLAPDDPRWAGAMKSWMEDGNDDATLIVQEINDARSALRDRASALLAQETPEETTP